ncbi:aminotransferase class V-fold PLP-dependent enzyme [Lactobacillus sp. ESL0233]|nr:aminotransferase class V-fold PLP-dependent enzyme [Lactobacillus sp. ESL0233]
MQYEAGTMNTLGIGSLYYGINYLNDLLQKTKSLITKLSLIKHVSVYSKPNPIRIVSFNIDGIIPSRLSTFLDEDADIKTRAGIICAPFIHEFLKINLFECVRVSMSQFNTEEEIEELINYISKVVSNLDAVKNINIPNIYSSPSIYNFD